jgi:hypothetical protein
MSGHDSDIVAVVGVGRIAVETLHLPDLQRRRHRSGGQVSEIHPRHRTDHGFASHLGTNVDIDPDEPTICPLSITSPEVGRFEVASDGVNIDSLGPATATIT